MLLRVGPYQLIQYDEWLQNWVFRVLLGSPSDFLQYPSSLPGSSWENCKKSHPQCFWRLGNPIAVEVRLQTQRQNWYWDPFCQGSSWGWGTFRWTRTNLGSCILSSIRWGCSFWRFRTLESKQVWQRVGPLCSRCTRDWTFSRIEALSRICCYYGSFLSNLYRRVPPSSPGRCPSFEEIIRIRRYSGI